MEVKLVSMTEPGERLRALGIKNAEEIVVYCARVSSPDNQLNTETAPKLLAYLIKNKHWSPFEMIDVTFEITTSRGISAQIIRHWSLSPQEFSQRYASVECVFEPQECRVKGATNRQGSVPTDDPALQLWWDTVQHTVQQTAAQTYQRAIEKGIAPEVARSLLPLGIQTRLYLKGSARDWIHYLEARCSDKTQKEHRIVALEIRKYLTKLLPNIASALEWLTE